VEINGQGILTFDADNFEMAERLAASPQFQSHLMRYPMVGGWVWGGPQPMRVREARLEEIDIWGTVFRANGEPERRCLVWLNALTDLNSRRDPN
jgi:hypothetical protein